MSEWFDAISQWLAGHPQWLGLVLLLICFGECLAMVGLLIPGTLLLFPVTTLAGSGVLNLSTALLLAFIGSLAGVLVSYALGRRYHQTIRQLPLLRDHPEWLLSAELYLDRYGATSLIVGHFIGPLRPMLPLAAGMLDMSFGRFLAASLVASAGWPLIYLMPGWATGAAIRLPLPEGFWREAGIIATVLVLLIGISFYCSLHKLRRVTLLIAGLCGSSLLVLTISWPHLTEFDQGLMAVIQQERTVTLDRVMIFITRFGDGNIQMTAGILLAVLLLALRQWRPALFASIVLLSSALANSALKHTFARSRPEILLDPLASYSFPSSHSSASFAFFLVLGTLAGREQPTRLRMICLLLACLPACLIALSRIYLGVHWPTDILGGALLSATFCATALALLQWRTPLPPPSHRAWSLILPACLGLLVAYALWQLPTGAELYRYK